MSVLIKGMKMPKKCGDCPCYDMDQDCCEITFDAVSCLDISGQNNCPLIEVKEDE